MDSQLSERQLQIISASIQLIGTKGIQGLTTKNLAAALNLSEPALYRHFKNKMQIIDSLLNYLKHKVQERHSAVLEQGGQPEKMLKQIIKNQFMVFSENPPIVTVLMSDGIFKNEPQLSGTVFSIMDYVRGVFTQVIKAGQKEKAFRKDLDAGTMAFVIMGSIRLTANLWSLSGFNYNINERGKELSKTLIKLLK